jgi:hypothetical protein
MISVFHVFFLVRNQTTDITPRVHQSTRSTSVNIGFYVTYEQATLGLYFILYILYLIIHDADAPVPHKYNITSTQ